MPPEHQKYLTYCPEEFKNWAKSIGNYTLNVVSQFLDSPKEPEQGYKHCVSLIKSAEFYGQIRMENACERLLSFTLHPSLRSITTILKMDRISIRQKNQFQNLQLLKNVAKELLVEHLPIETEVIPHTK